MEEVAYPCLVEEEDFQVEVVILLVYFMEVGEEVVEEEVVSSRLPLEVGEGHLVRLTLDSLLRQEGEVVDLQQAKINFKVEVEDQELAKC